MPKKRQIARLFSQPLASGVTMHHWKPSKTLRAAGFVNVKLGTDERAAIAAAIDLNDQVAAWQRQGTIAAADSTAPRAIAPRVVRVEELIRTYRAHSDYRSLRASTRKGYDCFLAKIDRWAMDGTLPVRAIDIDLVTRLRDELVAQASPHVAASYLRVLRLLLGFAKRSGIVRDNVATELRVPEPPSRKTRMPDRVREAIVAAAIELGERYEFIPLMIDLGLWTLQRRADILALNRIAWRQITGIEGQFVSALVDPRGRMMGFRLRQQKTGTWIDAPLPPFLHVQVEARMRDSAGGFVFSHPADSALPMPGSIFEVRFAEVRAAAAAVAIMEGNMPLAEAIDACQFRDLRRTGMIAYKDAGAPVPDITALSGHYVLSKKTIIDTYMPGDTEGACRCVAAGVTALAALAAQREQELVG